MSKTDREYPLRYRECWIDIYNDHLVTGGRLGIDFVRASLSSIDILVGDKTLTIEQKLNNEELSGVVWDAGLLITDFLKTNETLLENKTVLDLGCGTGVVGLVACLLNARSVTFTDTKRFSRLDSNILNLPKDLSERCLFVNYLWGEQLPAEFNGGVYDTVLCSDILYDERFFEPLMNTLRILRFQNLIISYKRRHSEPECQFLHNLSNWCSVQVVDSNCIQLVNVRSPTTMTGLYIIFASPL